MGANDSFISNYFIAYTVFLVRNYFVDAYIDSISRGLLTGH